MYRCTARERKSNAPDAAERNKREYGRKYIDWKAKRCKEKEINAKSRKMKSKTNKTIRGQIYYNMQPNNTYQKSTQLYTTHSTTRRKKACKAKIFNAKLCQATKRNYYIRLFKHRILLVVAIWTLTTKETIQSKDKRKMQKRHKNIQLTTLRITLAITVAPGMSYILKLYTHKRHCQTAKQYPSTFFHPFLALGTRILTHYWPCIRGMGHKKDWYERWQPTKREEKKWVKQETVRYGGTVYEKRRECIASTIFECHWRPRRK